MRTPANVHIYLYRKNKDDEYEFAIFQRSDDNKCWQGVAGGVEEGETFTVAARRELLEEAGVKTDNPLYKLESVSYLPAPIFSAHEKWGMNVIICPMYHYAMPYSGKITLSNEHTAMQWLPYEKAKDFIYWHDQEKALWELTYRLSHNLLMIADETEKGSWQNPQTNHLKTRLDS